MADSKDILRRVSDALSSKAGERKAEKEQQERERRELVTSIGKDIADALTPYMQAMAEKSQITKEELKAALSEVQINVPESHVNIPEIRVPESRVKVEMPEIKLPTFNIPQANIQYPDMMRVQMDGVDNLKPLPVMMMDTKGRPYQFPGGSTGGKADFLTIKNILNSTGGSVIDESTGAMKITGDIQVTAQAGTTISLINRDGEYYNGDNPVPVTFSAASIQPVSQVSGQAWSTSVIDIFGTTGTNIVNPDGRLKVELPTGSSGLTDTELRATAVPVSQVSGANFSVSVTDIFGSTGTGFYNLDNRVRVELPSFTQVISSADIFATTATSNVVNPDNRVKVELPATSVTVLSITATTASNIVDSTGIAYSGSNPVPVTLISGGLTSTISVGPVVADAVDDGSAPIQSGGIARTANPTAVSGNDVVKSTYDDLGRQVMRPVQVRDLMATAYASLTNGTETTLLAASAGSFHDLIYIMGSNNSDAAVTVDIRPVTAGNVVMTLGIPAYGTAGVACPVPYPQSTSDTGNNWTADMGDITGTTVYVSGLFTKEV